MSKYAVYLTVLLAIVVIVESQRIPCRKNEIWSNCPTSCPLTCKNPKPADACIQVCRKPSCVCKKGFVLNGMDCVRPQDCKRHNQCPVNQVWSDCPSSCPRTCDKPNTGACNKVCRKPGCVCKKGFVLKGKQCVPVKHCKN